MVFRISFDAMDESQANPPERKVRKRSRRSKRHQTSFFRDFRFEIFIAFLFLLGAFLLFEDLEIKAAVFSWISGAFKTITLGSSELVNNFLQWLIGFETSDIVGLILILIATFLFSYRLRQKAIQRYGELHTCPECGSGMMHIHRTPLQRFAEIVFYLKIRNYKCKSCDYQGIRIRQHKSH